MSNSGRPRFACPADKQPLSEDLRCDACGRTHPRVRGVPILLNEERSVFRIADYVQAVGYQGASGHGGSRDRVSGLRRLSRRTVRALEESGPPRTFGVADCLAAVRAEIADPSVLVIGAGDSKVDAEATITDAAFGAHVECIVDAHDLPFPDGTFDLCIAVAVLEHVADRYRCVAEMVRVLRPRGYVYAETPFLQPAHMGVHDFTRFTLVGHRRLFRTFEEIRSGMLMGPWWSAGQALRYAIGGLSDRPHVRGWLRLAGLLLTYPFRWVDRLAPRTRAASDAASAFVFFGRLAERPIGDRDLVKIARVGSS